MKGVFERGFAGSYNVSKMPSSANGNSYCRVDLAGNTHISTAMYLNDGSCFNGVSCSKGILSVYSSRMCAGDIMETYNVAAGVTNANTKNLTSSKWGTIKAMSLHTVSTGSLDYQWTTFYPQSAYVPLNSSPIEIFGSTCQVIALLISLVSCLHYARLALTISSNKAKIYTLFALSHLLWFVYENVDIYYEYLSTESVDLYLAVTEADGVLMSLAMLATVFVNAHTVMHLVFKPSAFYQALVYLALILLHTALAGGTYVTFLQTGAGQLSNSLMTWTYTFSVYWTVFMFLFDSLASLICAVFIVKVGRKCDNLYEAGIRAFQERHIITSFVAQMIITISFYFIYLIVRFSTITGNDRTDSSLQYGVGNVLLAAHAAISCRNFDYFSTLLQKMQAEEKEAKAAKDFGSELILDDKAIVSFPASLRPITPILSTHTILNAEFYTPPSYNPDLSLYYSPFVHSPTIAPSLSADSEGGSGSNAAMREDDSFVGPKPLRLSVSLSGLQMNPIRPPPSSRRRSSFGFV